MENEILKKAAIYFANHTVKYKFIEENSALSFELLEVSSSYYEWLSGEERRTSKNNLKIFNFFK